jgi:hypothetical protein
VLNMETGAVDENSGIDNPLTYNQLKASKDSAMSFAVESNRARVSRVPITLPSTPLKTRTAPPRSTSSPSKAWGSGAPCTDSSLSTKT